MKKTLITVLLSLIFMLNIHGQQAQEEKNHHQKIEEFKNLKLVEYLHLDEQRGIKLIARKKENDEILSKLITEKDSLLDYAKNTPGLDKSEQTKLVIRILKNEKKIISERAKYFNSLSDLLSEKEILDYLVFEKEFRKELRDLMMRRKENEK